MRSFSILLYRMGDRRTALAHPASNHIITVDSFYERYRYYQRVVSEASLFIGAAVIASYRSISFPQCGLVVAFNNSSPQSAPLLYPGVCVLWGDDSHLMNLSLSLAISKSLDMMLLYYFPEDAIDVVSRILPEHVHTVRKEYYISPFSYDPDRIIVDFSARFRINNSPFIMKRLGIVGDISVCVISGSSHGFIVVSGSASLDDAARRLFTLYRLGLCAFVERESVNRSLDDMVGRDTILARMVRGGGMSTDFLRIYRGGQFVGV